MFTGARLSRGKKMIFVVLFYSAVPLAQGFAYERIVSLGPINTENVFLLGAEQRLVANTDYCTRPEEARGKEKIGSVLQVSVEKIISLHPDLVLATALTRPEHIRKLRAAGITVVRFRQPRSFAEICRHFLKLGQLLGLEKRAQEVIAVVQQEVATIQKQVAPLPAQRVFLQVGSQPLFGSVKSSFTHDFIVLAGGINSIGDQKTGDTKLERVISANPDVIVIAIMGSEMGIAGHEKKRWQKVPVLKAVQGGRIHIVDPDLVCSPSPATFAQTLRLMARLIHPELKGDAK